MKLHAILKADGCLYPVAMMTDQGAFLLGIAPAAHGLGFCLHSPELHIIGETVPPANGAFCQNDEIQLCDEHKRPVVIELTPDPMHRTLDDLRGH